MPRIYMVPRISRSRQATLEAFINRNALTRTSTSTLTSLIYNIGAIFSIFRARRTRGNGGDTGGGKPIK